MKIAFVGYEIQEKYKQGVSDDEDGELLFFLQQKGLQVNTVVWNDKSISWETFDIVLVKSPWDYHEDIALFYSWLEKIKVLNIKMLNPVDVIKWNSNKRYLADISEAGLPVIPSVYLTKESKIPTGSSLFEQLNTHKIVVKPCVSAGAKNTIVLDRENIGEQSETINALLSQEEYIAQPFVEEIANGEWSFIFFDGEYSHCALKVPKQGDFRVQHYHGGSILYPDPEPGYIRQAEKYVSAFAPGTLYARVDGIVKSGTLFLMEIELIEPYLFLNAEKERQERYYQALKKMIS